MRPPIPSFNRSQSHEIEALATENQLLPANCRVEGRFRDDEFQNSGGVIGCARIEEI
jgi:hypothetical protein